MILEKVELYHSDLILSDLLYYKDYVFANPELQSINFIPLFIFKNL